MSFNNLSKYKRENVELQLSKCEDVTFINVIIVGKEVLKVEAETYSFKTKDDTNVASSTNCFRSIANKENCLRKIDEMNILFYDEKQRQTSTLKKIGATREDLLNGVKQPDAAKKISGYFVEHAGIIISYKTYSQIAALNKIIQAHQYKSIDNALFDMRLMAEYCRESYPDKGNIQNTKDAFCFCLKKYKRFEKLEQNKCACTVNYAYYWLSEYRKYMEWIFCNTSIGVIYYDVISERWGITKKESKKNGLLIESVDTDDVQKQLFRKYHVNSMEELKAQLIKYRKSTKDMGVLTENMSSVG